MVLIVHFTHKSNLTSIFSAKALVCDHECKASMLTVTDIAYSDLKTQRAATLVEVPPGKTLDYYVPFYFGPRSPMLYAYKGGYVTGKVENQDDIVYFVADTDTISGRAQFAFTDGHPIREPKAFYNDLSELSQVDLDLMKAKYWADTDTDPDRKRRRQAEFLIWGRVPLGLMLGMVARNDATQTEVQALIAANSLDLRCYVRPTWYYD